MINCRDAAERLWTYIDRHVERAKDEELEQHLGLCRHCCGELEFARQVRAKLAELDTQASPEVLQRLRDFARSLEQRQ